MWVFLIAGILAWNCFRSPLEDLPDDLDDPPFNLPLSKAEKDPRRPFQIDSKKPFHIEFGRGSGWHGLETVKIDQNGKVTLFRLQCQRLGDGLAHSWKTANLLLPPKCFDKMLKAVETNDLMKLEKAYHADVADGTQWVLWIKQGAQEKSVYFNNHFPQQILRFSEQLNEILSESGLAQAVWEGFPGSESRIHERELWNSIKR